jgi:serine O-acetyltransferase
LRRTGSEDCHEAEVPGGRSGAFKPMSDPPVGESRRTETPGGVVEVSALAPDWTRERCRRLWDPPRRLLRSIRAYQRHRERGLAGWLSCKFSVVSHRFWSVVTGADIPLDCQIGGGLLLPHPNGVVIHPDAVIGPNCLLFQQVTLGNGGPMPGAPILGGHVDVGAGAKILGGVRVGDHARIGANAVVLQHVPPGATAVGIPARILSPPGPVENRDIVDS